MSSYKIAFLNSKGGVGKSTLCMLSAISLSKSKFKGKVKLVDTDSQKSSSSILANNKHIELEYIPFNHSSPGLGASLLDQKLKSYPREKEVMFIDTMAHPPRQLINCLMQCDAIIIPCNLSEVEILATIEFIKWLDGLKKNQLPSSGPHLVVLPNRVPPNQRYISLLTDYLSEVDVIIGPTISDLALLRNNLSSIQKHKNQNSKRFEIEYKNLSDFIFKALVNGGIDRLLKKDEHNENEVNRSDKSNIIHLTA